MAAPKPKLKTINYSAYARYEGLALKKTPLGDGELYPCSRCTVKGNFNGNTISSGTISFTDHKFVIKGDLTFEVSQDKQITIYVRDGKIGDKKLPANHPIKFEDDNYTFEVPVKTYYRLPKEYYETLKIFAGATDYTRTSDGQAVHIYNNEKRTRKTINRSSFVDIAFANGTKAHFDVASRTSHWSRPNGEFITFTLSEKGEGQVTKYKVASPKTIISDKDITHTFANGNKYVGTITNEFRKSCIDISNIGNLIFFKGIGYWDWSNFENSALNGTIYYADGTSEKIINGITEAEAARREAERKAEEERKAKEEAERKAKEEAERKEREQKWQALKKTEYLTFTNSGVVATFKSVKKDLSIFTYDRTKTPRLVLVYANGDQLKYLSTNEMDKYTYNYFNELEYAPNIYSWDEWGERVFANEKTKFSLNHNGKLKVITPKLSNGDYAVYECFKGNPLTVSEFIHTYTNHKLFKSIKTTSNKIVFKDGSYYEGTFTLKYDPNIEIALNQNQHIKGFGVEITKSPENCVGVEYRSGNMYNAAGKLIAIYEYGKKLDDFDFQQRCALIAAEKAAKEEEARQERLLQQKIAALKKKYSARFVNALVDGTFLEDMPFNLFKDFYGANALEYTGYGRDGNIVFMFYDLNIGDYSYSLTFYNNKLVL